jgi:hypothetical protein
MPGMTSGATSLEIIDADGNVTPLMLARKRDGSGAAIDGRPPSLQEALVAQASDAPLEELLTTNTTETWIGGVGLSYNVAIGVDTRTDGAAFPAGLMTDVQGVSITDAGPIVKFAEYGADVFYAQEGTASVAGKVCRSVGGTGVLGGAFATTLALTVGEYVRDLFLYHNGTASIFLYATSSDANGLNGRLHRWDGATWSSTAAATFNLTPDGVNRYGRNRSRSANWLTPDGVTAWRFKTISGPNKVSYTVSDTADPFLAASWVEGVRVLTKYSLRELTGSRQVIFDSAKDGLFALNGQGESPNLMAYMEDRIHPANGMAVQYLDGYVYYASGESGLERVKVDPEGVLQESPGVCRPGFGTPARSEWLGGYTTALTSEGGWLVNATYNPITQRAAIWRGIDRDKVGIKSPNPVIWHGPMATINANYMITAMMPSSQAGDHRLWVSARSQTGGQAVVAYLSLSEAGSGIDDLISEGSHRFTTETGSGIFNPYCRLELLPIVDRASLHILHQTEIISEGLDSGNGTKLTVYTRADPSPGSVAWGTGQDVTASPSQTLTPSTTTEGHRIERRIDFINPHGGDDPPVLPVLEAVRESDWKIAPDFSVRLLDVEWGSLIPDLDGREDERNPEDVLATIRALTRTGRVTLRGQDNSRYVVKIPQVLNLERVVHGMGDYGVTMRATLKAILTSDDAI